MDRAYASGASATPPTPPASPSTGYPTAGNPATAVPPTKPGKYWYHMIMEELMAVVDAAGISPNHNNLTQLLSALRSAGVFQTAPQFDNDTSVATTEFVRRQGLQAAGVTTMSATGSIVASHVGKSIQLYPTAAPITLTLPAASTLPSGARIEFWHNGSRPATIQRQGGDVLIANNVTETLLSITLNSGDSITLEAYGTYWLMVSGSAQLGYSTTAFGSSLAANGYQKLPSGLIIQWGSVTAAGSTGGATVTFPIAFPTAALCAVASSADDNNSACAGLISSSSMYITGLNHTTTAPYNVNSPNGTIHKWIAIGY